MIPTGTYPWLPSFSSNLVHWYKAEDLRLNDGDPVDAFLDVKGGVNLTNTLTARPTYKYNNNAPYIEFDGSNDYLGTTSFTTFTGDYSYFIIWELYSSSGTNPFAMTVIDGGNTIYLGQNGTPTSMLGYIFPNGVARTIPAEPTGFMCSYIERVGSAGKYRQDGSEGTFTAGTGTTSATFYVGSNAGSASSKIRVKELAFFNSAAPSNLATYINDKYGLTL